MRTIPMPTPTLARSSTSEWNPLPAAVDPQDNLPSLLQQSEGRRTGQGPQPHSRLQHLEIREMLCEMLVASVWEDGHGRVRKERKNYGEDHKSTTRA